MTLNILRKLIPYLIIVSVPLLILTLIYYYIANNNIILILATIAELVCLSGLLLYLFGNLRTHIDILERQCNALHSAIALSKIPLKKPAFFLRHSVSPDFVELMAEIIRRRNVRNVLELGCGTSSIYIASLLSDKDLKGQLICLEDNKDWADFIQLQIDKEVNTLDSKQCMAKVIHVPIIYYKNIDTNFYDINMIAFNDSSIYELLVVDGPADVKMRKAALPLLRKLLSDNALVIVDDGDHAVVRNTIKV